jgi:hypothetical protein
MPAAGGNGLAMRQGQFLAAYPRDYDVDLAVIPLAGAADADDRFARRLAQRLQVFALADVDTHFSLAMRLHDPAARLAAFAVYGRPSIAARLTAAVRLAVADWVAGQNYALVHIGRLYLLGLNGVADAQRVVDADEDDACVFRQMAQTARRAGRQQAADWAVVEAANATQAAAAFLPGIRHVFTASAADAASLEAYNKSVTVIPNTIARPVTAPARQQLRILFVGTLDYGPNEEGLAWFIRYCWPLLHRLLPLLRLDVVGGGGSLALRRLARTPGIFWHGRQPNLRRFYTQAGTVIVPVLTGGGSRIKLLEAAAYGRAIVATAAGAAGSGFVPNRDFIRADTPSDFVQAVCGALDRQRFFGKAARLAVAQKHDPVRWQARILKIVAKIASAKAS